MDHWSGRAACLGMEQDDWFPPNNPSVANQRAIAICYGCPVRQECLDSVMVAEVNSSRCGIFGGLNATDRNRLAKGDESVLKIPTHPCGHPKSIEHTHWVSATPRCVHCNPARFKCGTRSAYRRHLRNNEEPCGPCRRANASQTADNRARKQAAA
jgi:hypothetical protein